MSLRGVLIRLCFIFWSSYFRSVLYDQRGLRDTDRLYDLMCVLGAVPFATFMKI